MTSVHTFPPGNSPRHPGADRGERRLPKRLDPNVDTVLNGRSRG